MNDNNTKAIRHNNNTVIEYEQGRDNRRIDLDISDSDKAISHTNN